VSVIGGASGSPISVEFFTGMHILGPWPCSLGRRTSQLEMINGGV
jgi:hypothetical protein